MYGGVEYMLMIKIDFLSCRLVEVLSKVIYSIIFVSDNFPRWSILIHVVDLIYLG